MSTNDFLLFPSGRSVGNCRKDAKRLSKEHAIPLSHAQDIISEKNGMSMSWSKAMAALPSLQRHKAPKPSLVSFMTENDVKSVMERYPSLTHFGMGVSMRGMQSREDIQKSYAQGRQELIAAVDECNKAIRFLAHTSKRKTPNTKRSSYGLKHSVEHYMENLPDVKNHYVANGSFICAAIHAGFDICTIREGNPNVMINISERSPILLWSKLSGQSYKTRTQLEQLAELETMLGIPTHQKHVGW